VYKLHGAGELSGVMEGNSRKRAEPYDHITGAILAGGLSTRYGQNKAFLELAGIRLIDRVVAEMKKIFRDVILIANERGHYEYLGVPVVEDVIKGLGPLGAIYTGLMRISNETGFFVACDMPFINAQLVRYMVDIRDNYAAVVPSGAAGIEPLHAIYTRACLAPIKDLLNAQQYQVRLFYERVSVRYVTPEEIRKFVSPQTAFLNINTPDEFARVQRLKKNRARR
jgi:molybdopterin-guanine dinucleotide biosynthesis protein A